MDHVCVVRFCFNEVANENDICESCQASPLITTTCSRMHCYNKAVVTNDPARPPFCEPCKQRKRR